MKLGMNLAAINYGQNDCKAGDVLVHGTNWHGTERADGGWPAGDRILPQKGNMQPALLGYRRAGIYTLQAEGSGVIAYQDTTIGSPEFAFGVIPGGAPSHQIQLKGGEGLGAIVVIADNAGGKLGLKNLQLLSPGAVPGQLWHPQYLSSLSSFKGALRFYDWNVLDFSVGGTWESRVQWAGRGIEAAVDLCNRTGRDMWLNIPVHCLTPQGLTDLASGLGKYLGANLRKDLTVYAEPGNEIWNGQPGYVWQYYYLQQMAQVMIDPNTGKPFGSPWLLACYLLHMATNAIKENFPNVKSILSGQLTWYGNSDFYLVTWDAREKWPYDGIAAAPYATWPNVAPYTTTALSDLIAAGNMDAAFSLMSEGMKYTVTKDLLPCLVQYQQVAKSAGVPLYFYEMGPDYGSLWNNKLTAPAAKAFRHSKQAGEFCTWFLQQVGPFAEMGMWFQDVSDDCYGAKANADDADSTIWQSICAYSQSN